MILTTSRPVPFFPAHTGKTSSFSWLLRRSAVHPRPRGENIKQIARDVEKTGSSPLTQGKHASVWSAHAGHGLIPAHAWKTTCCRRAKPLEWAHPRSREDNIFIVTPWGQGEGSSPLTQGKHHDPDHQSASTVLPRSRGENQCRSLIFCARSGSSPLTRGKPY